MPTLPSLLHTGRRWLLVGGLMLLCACTPPPEQNLLNDTAQAALLPAHRDFALAAQQLAQASQAFCQAPDEAGLSANRGAWQHSATAWSALQLKSFGPLTEDNISWQIQFWPDRKNLVARKLEGLLKNIDADTAINAEAVAQASVVVQGLSALEYLLFDEVAGQLQPYLEQPQRCQMLMAIAEHQRRVSQSLFEAWLPEGGNYLATFLNPGPENLIYPDHRQAMAALLESLVSGAELIKRDKLERPLGLAKDDARPQVYLLEWWRSRFSKEAIIGNLNGLQRLYLADELYGLDDYLREHQHGELAKRLVTAFERSIKAASAIDVELFHAGQDAASRAEIDTLYKAVSELLELLKEPLPEALGITLSFNGADGD